MPHDRLSSSARIRYSQFYATFAVILPAAGTSQRFRDNAHTKPSAPLAELCGLTVSNGPKAISATDNEVEVLTPAGEVLASIAGTKETVASRILEIIEERLIALWSG